MPALPSAASVVEALTAAEAEQPQPSTAPDEQTPPEAPKTDGAPEGTPPATPPEGAPPAAPPETEQPSDPVAAYAALIRSKTARVAFDSLPDDVKEQIAAEMYPGVHRHMSKKEVARTEAKRELDALKSDISKVVNDRFDELMTQGLPEEDKKTYFDRKRLAALDEQQQRDQQPPRTEEPVLPREVLEEAQQKMEYAWGLVEKAGLPRDPNDPRVRALDFAWDEADFGKAMQRLNTSLRAKGAAAPANGQPKGNVATPPAAAPDVEAVKKIAGEMAAQMVRDELKRLNLLTTDDGRPGAASGAPKPRTLAEAAAEARRIILSEPGR